MTYFSIRNFVETNWCVINKYYSFMSIPVIEAILAHCSALFHAVLQRKRHIMYVVWFMWSFFVIVSVAVVVVGCYSANLSAGWSHDLFFSFYFFFSFALYVLKNNIGRKTELTTMTTTTRAYISEATQCIPNQKVDCVNTINSETETEIWIFDWILKRENIFETEFNFECAKKKKKNYFCFCEWNDRENRKTIKMQTFALLCAMSVGAAIVIAKPNENDKEVLATKQGDRSSKPSR